MAFWPEFVAEIRRQVSVETESEDVRAMRGKAANVSICMAIMMALYLFGADYDALSALFASLTVLGGFAAIGVHVARYRILSHYFSRAALVLTVLGLGGVSVVAKLL